MDVCGGGVCDMGILPLSGTWRQLMSIYVSHIFWRQKLLLLWEKTKEQGLCFTFALFGTFWHSQAFWHFLSFFLCFFHGLP